MLCGEGKNQRKKCFALSFFNAQCKHSSKMSQVADDNNSATAARSKPDEDDDSTEPISGIVNFNLKVPPRLRYSQLKRNVFIQKNINLFLPLLRKYLLRRKPEALLVHVENKKGTARNYGITVNEVRR